MEHEHNDDCFFGGEEPSDDEKRSMMDDFYSHIKEADGLIGFVNIAQNRFEIICVTRPDSYGFEV